MALTTQKLGLAMRLRNTMTKITVIVMELTTQKKLGLVMRLRNITMKTTAAVLAAFRPTALLTMVVKIMSGTSNLLKQNLWLAQMLMVKTAWKVHRIQNLSLLPLLRSGTRTLIHLLCMKMMTWKVNVIYPSLNISTGYLQTALPLPTVLNQCGIIIFPKVFPSRMMQVKVLAIKQRRMKMQQQMSKAQMRAQLTHMTKMKN
mmetsp:Transcript_26962/g.56924  ORF Transcript_26962/g.56924 Transcript_26962/m.56924 type:complete len:202 (-) Transcript_26962:2506-3111(-)